MAKKQAKPRRKVDPNKPGGIIGIGTKALGGKGLKVDRKTGKLFGVALRKKMLETGETDPIKAGKLVVKDQLKRARKLTKKAKEKK